MSKYLFGVMSIAVVSVGVVVGVNYRSDAEASMVCDMPSMQKSVISQKSQSSVLMTKTSCQDPSQQSPSPQQPPEQDNSFQDFPPPAPAQQPETDKHCERPNPDGSNPDVGGVDPNKIGCKCARKCENGRPTENTEDGKRCKVHCKPDHCECPNPCTKT